MERTLYLNENDGITVKIDGPSLWIKERHRAGRRVPVRLIGQVIIAGNIKMESGIVTLLSEHGVPVIFLSRGKGITAAAHAVNSTYSATRNKVLRLARSEKGQLRVKEWLCSTRHNFKLSLLKKLFPAEAWKINEKGMKDRDIDRLLDSALSHLPVPARQTGVAEREKIAIITATLEGLFHECVLKQIMDFELDPHTGFIHLHQDFAFVKDLCYALEAERDYQLIQFFRGSLYERYFYKEKRCWTINSEGMKNIAVRFENRKKEVLKHIALLLDEFFEILREPLL